mgnify:CR=1 FL=1
MTKDPLVFVKHILQAISKIESYIKEYDLDSFRQDDKTKDAVVRELEIIGEAANNIPPEFIKSHSEVNWRGPIGLRNKLIHEYFGIDVKRVWRITQKDLEPLKSELSELILGKQ